MLKEWDHLPEGFLSARPADLEGILGGPALIHLPGRRPDPVFVSVMLHGNEPAGLEAVQALLRNPPPGGLPRSLSLFVGNVSAARLGVRRLEGQADYNRVWPGSDTDDTPEHRLMARITDRMRELDPFASVDVHNNTGLNPHYACVNRLEHRFLQLATLFGRTVVYFIRPRGVQSLAFAEFCPAVTLECGKAGDARGVEHARDFITACLQLAKIPSHPVAPHDIDLFHTVAVVKVPDSVTFSFTSAGEDLQFDPDLDRMNFRELPAGTALATVRSTKPVLVEARSETGEDVTEEYFTVHQDRLVLRRPMMPSMLTLDERVVRQDCLCYLMERMEMK
ncbi:peptidase M14 [Thioalkalivibrio denitrificans]|uniref:Peptidase M14 n=1 Tax=Thioalkalivibrio denitrificans TaxID=108003 RepID=A0A1V3NEH9_9GAMM|nr:M14 family metallopeptidase [Thioalkalivibrio denitrificans]OOG23288.1 peptidase M14 [Thioalkalivibrio denitrificans]